jgi:hypothetical protein
MEFRRVREHDASQIKKVLTRMVEQNQKIQNQSKGQGRQALKKEAALKKQTGQALKKGTGFQVSKKEETGATTDQDAGSGQDARSGLAGPSTQGLLHRLIGAKPAAQKVHTDQKEHTDQKGPDSSTDKSLLDTLTPAKIEAAPWPQLKTWLDAVKIEAITSDFLQVRQVRLRLKKELKELKMKDWSKKNGREASMLQLERDEMIIDQISMINDPKFKLTLISNIVK